MRTCKNCGAQMDDDCNFCVQCGSQMSSNDLTNGEGTSMQNNQQATQQVQQPATQQQQPAYQQQPVYPQQQTAYPHQQPAYQQQQPAYPQQQPAYQQQQPAYQQQQPVYQQQQPAFPQQQPAFPQQQPAYQQPVQQNGYSQQMQQGNQQFVQQSYQPSIAPNYANNNPGGIVVPSNYNPSLPTVTIHWKTNPLNYFAAKFHKISINVNGNQIVPRGVLSYKEYTLPFNHNGGNVNIEVDDLYEILGFTFHVVTVINLNLKPGESYKLELTNRYLIQNTKLYGYKLYDSFNNLLEEDKAPMLHKLACLTVPLLVSIFVDPHRHIVKSGIPF